MGLLTSLKIFRTLLNEHSKWAATIDQSAVSASAFRGRASKWVLLWITGTFLLQLCLNLKKMYILYHTLTLRRHAVVRNVRKCGGLKYTHLYRWRVVWRGVRMCVAEWLCLTVLRHKATVINTYWYDVRYVLYNIRSICFHIPINHMLFKLGNNVIRVYIVRIT